MRLFHFYGLRTFHRLAKMYDIQDRQWYTGQVTQISIPFAKQPFQEFLNQFNLREFLAQLPVIDI